MARHNYLDHKAEAAGLDVVNLIIRVPDGRVLLYKNRAAALVPRFKPGWQVSATKALSIGTTVREGLVNCIYFTLGMSKTLADEVTFLFHYGYNKKTMYIYSLALEKSTMITPSLSSELFALPWETVLEKWKNKSLSFCDESEATVEILSSHRIGGF